MWGTKGDRWAQGPEFHFIILSQWFYQCHSHWYFSFFIFLFWLCCGRVMYSFCWVGAESGSVLRAVPRRAEKEQRGGGVQSGLWEERWSEPLRPSVQLPSGCPSAWLPSSLTKPREGAQSTAWFARRRWIVFPRRLLLSLPFCRGTSAVGNVKPLKRSGGWASLGRGTLFCAAWLSNTAKHLQLYVPDTSAEIRDLILSL